MTKAIDFDFGAYVERGKAETSRARRRKALRIASKVASVAREVLDIYSAVKRKDPISVALGAISTYGCVSELFEGASPQAQEHLREMGAVKVFPMMCPFIFHTLQQMDVAKQSIWNSGEGKGDEPDPNERIEEFDLGHGVKVWFIESGNAVGVPDQGPYVLDQQEFVGRFSGVIEEKLGRTLTINTIARGWDEFFYLGPLQIPTALYVSSIDEEALMARITDLQKLGFNRSLLFFGPPGIGKTTLSARLAERTGGRLLVAPCGVLETTPGRQIIGDLVDIIDPTVILMDDLDKMWRPSEMLGSMELLNRKVGLRKRLLIGTVNSLAKIPDTLRRPGRFDEIVEFHPLTGRQRKDIIATYAKEFGVVYTGRELERLAAATDGMTGAYLKEIVLRASVVPFGTLLEQVEQMRRICNVEEQEEVDNTKSDNAGKRRRKRVGRSKPFVTMNKSLKPRRIR
jgi:DNA polymerase III delta prime subunit